MKRLFDPNFYQEAVNFFTSPEYQDILPSIQLERTHSLLLRVKEIDSIPSKDFDELKGNTGLLLELGIDPRKIKTKEQFIQAIQSSIPPLLDPLLKKVISYESRKFTEKFGDDKSKELQDVQMVLKLFYMAKIPDAPINRKVAYLKDANNKLNTLPQEIASHRKEIEDLSKCRQEQKYCSNEEKAVIDWVLGLEQRLEKNNNWLIIYKQEKINLLKMLLNLPQTSQVRIDFLAILNLTEKERLEIKKAEDTAKKMQELKKEYEELKHFSDLPNLNYYFKNLEVFTENKRENIDPTLSILRNEREKWANEIAISYNTATEEYKNLYGIEKEGRDYFNFAVSQNWNNTTDEIVTEIREKNNKKRKEKEIENIKLEIRTDSYSSDDIKAFDKTYQNSIEIFESEQYKSVFSKEIPASNLRLLKEVEKLEPIQERDFKEFSKQQYNLLERLSINPKNVNSKENLIKKIRSAKDRITNYLIECIQKYELQKLQERFPHKGSVEIESLFKFVENTLPNPSFPISKRLVSLKALNLLSNELLEEIKSLQTEFEKIKKHCDEYEEIQPYSGYSLCSMSDREVNEKNDYDFKLENTYFKKSSMESGKIYIRGFNNNVLEYAVRRGDQVNRSFISAQEISKLLIPLETKEFKRNEVNRFQRFLPKILQRISEKDHIGPITHSPEELIIQWVQRLETILQEKKPGWLKIYKEERNNHLFKMLFSLRPVSPLRKKLFDILEPTEKEQKAIEQLKEQEKVQLEKDAKEMQQAKQEYENLKQFSTDSQVRTLSYCFKDVEDFLKNKKDPVESTLAKLREDRIHWEKDIRQSYQRASSKHVELFEVKNVDQKAFEGAVDNNQKNEAERIVIDILRKNSEEESRREQERLKREEEERIKREIETLQSEIKGASYSDLAVLNGEITKIAKWLGYNESVTESLQAFAPKLNALKSKISKLEEEIKEIEKLKDIKGLETLEDYQSRSENLRFKRSNFEAIYSSIHRDLQTHSRDITDLLIEVFNQKKDQVSRDYTGFLQSVSAAHGNLLTLEVLNGHELELNDNGTVEVTTYEKTRKQKVRKALGLVSQKMGDLKNTVSSAISPITDINLTMERLDSESEPKGEAIETKEIVEEVTIDEQEINQNDSRSAYERFSGMTEILTLNYSSHLSPLSATSPEPDSQHSTPRTRTPTQTSSRTSSFDDDKTSTTSSSPMSEAKSLEDLVVVYKTTPEEIHSKLEELETYKNKIPGYQADLQKFQAEAEKVSLDHALNHSHLIERLRQSKIFAEERKACYTGLSKKTRDKRNTAELIIREYTNLISYAQGQEGDNLKNSFRNLKSYITEFENIAKKVEGNCYSFHSQTYTEHDKVFVRKLLSDVDFITDFFAKKGLLQVIQLRTYESKHVEVVKTPAVIIGEQLTKIDEQLSQCGCFEKTRKKKLGLNSIKRNLESMAQHFVESEIKPPQPFTKLFEELKKSETGFTKAAITENRGFTLFGKNTWEDYEFITQFQEAMANLETATRNLGLLPPVKVATFT